MRRGVLVGSAAVLLAVAGLSVIVSARSTSSLDDGQREVVEAIESDGLEAEPEAAARFVDEHLDALLSAQVADALDGEVLAGVFDAALHHDTPSLLGRIVAAVAAEGEIYANALRPVFANAAALQIAWVDERITAPADYSASDLPDRLRDNYLAIHDFLRETMRDPESAQRLRRALDDYGMAKVAKAPADRRERDEWLRNLGVVQAVFNQAQLNAERGQAIEDEDPAALEGAEAAGRSRGADSVTMRTVWLATDLYRSNAEVREAVRGQPFVDADGALKIAMTQNESDAFHEWAKTLVDPGGRARSDDAAIAAGVEDVQAPIHGVSVEDRY